MIKGINRQIIEVTDTGNTYFERALLVVRPSCVDCREEQLQQEARRMLQVVGGYSGLRKYRRRRMVHRVAWGFSGVALGVGLSWFLAQVGP